jgi:hypothetical protein
MSNVRAAMQRAGKSRALLISLLVAIGSGVLVLKMLQAVLDDPSNLPAFQVLSYTPLGLLVFPLMWLVSFAAGLVAGAITYVWVRKASANSPRSEQAQPEESSR